MNPFRLLINAFAKHVGERLNLVREIPIQISGQFLLDPNETNTWGVIGFVDQSNTFDAGNADATSLSYNVGGLCFPFPVEVLSLTMVHRVNNSGANPFGFVLGYQTHTYGTNDSQETFIIHEVNGNGGVGPREYGDVWPRLFSEETKGMANAIIPANAEIFLGVSSPTADTTNRYVQVSGGCLLVRRVLPAV